MNPATMQIMMQILGSATKQRNNTNALTNTEPARRTNLAFWIMVFLALIIIALISYQLLK